MKTKLFAILALCLSAFIARAGEFPDISVTDLKAAIDSKKVVVIDVNGPGSYKKGHIPGALSFSEVKKELASKLPAEKDTLIVAYCGGPKCNAYSAAAKAAKELGYTNVKHLSAGISGWKQAGQPTEAVN
jgi:rhodanese-related sulfurtransferase